MKEGGGREREGRSWSGNEEGREKWKSERGMEGEKGSEI